MNTKSGVVGSRVSSIGKRPGGSRQYLCLVTTWQQALNVIGHFSLNKAKSNVLLQTVQETCLGLKWFRLRMHIFYFVRRWSHCWLTGFFWRPVQHIDSTFWWGSGHTVGVRWSCPSGGRENAKQEWCSRKCWDKGPLEKKQVEWEFWLTQISPLYTWGVVCKRCLAKKICRFKNPYISMDPQPSITSSQHSPHFSWQLR